MQRVLVIGGSGRLGSSIVSELERRALPYLATSNEHSTPTCRFIINDPVHLYFNDFFLDNGRRARELYRELLAFIIKYKSHMSLHWVGSTRISIQK